MVAKRAGVSLHRRSCSNITPSPQKKPPLPQSNAISPNLRPLAPPPEAQAASPLPRRVLFSPKDSKSSRYDRKAVDNFKELDFSDAAELALLRKLDADAEAARGTSVLKGTHRGTYKKKTAEEKKEFEANPDAAKLKRDSSDSQVRRD